MKKKTVKKSTRTQKSGRPVGLKKSKRKTSQKSSGTLKTTLKPLYIDLKNVRMYHNPLPIEETVPEAVWKRIREKERQQAEKKKKSR